MSIPSCRDCTHYRETTVFELCQHPEGTYRVAGEVDQHTISHMRLYKCGSDGRLFAPRA